MTEKATGVPLKGGDEYDMLTKARRFHKPRPGEAKAAKRRYTKRVRRAVRKSISTYRD